MSVRREFSRAVKIEIIRRATWSDGHVLRDQYCEKCRQPTKGRFEIHHLREDALEIYKGKPLKAEDGALWCIPCHKEHTASVSVPAIARAKRREADHLRAEKPNKAKVARHPKPERSTAKLDSMRALGGPGLSRQGFVSIGSASKAVLEKFIRKDAAE